MNPFPQSRVQVTDDPQRVTTRAKAIPLVRLGTSAADIVTAPPAFDFLLDHLAVTNIDTSARTVTLYLAAAGSAADANAIAKAFSVGASTTIKLDWLTGYRLMPGATISGLASVADVVHVWGWGSDVG